MKPIDYVILGVIVAAVAAVILLRIYNKKKGKGSCSCGCQGCAMSEHCHNKK